MKTIIALFTIIMLACCSDKHEEDIVKYDIAGTWLVQNSRHPYHTLIITDDRFVTEGDIVTDSEYRVTENMIHFNRNGLSVEMEYRFDYGGLIIEEKDDNFGWLLFIKND